MTRIELTEDQFDSVLYNFQDWIDDGAEVRRNYGGRGMFGTTCVGVVSNTADGPMAFLYLVAEELYLPFLELIQDIGGGEMDSMGLSTITYWRGLTVQGPSEEDGG